jgi:hypothetical protein
VSVGLWQSSVNFVGPRNCLIFECSGIQIVLVTIYFRLLASTFQSVFTLYLVCGRWQWRCGGRGGGRLNIVNNSSSNKGGSFNAPYGPNQIKSCSDANSWFGKGYKEHSEQSFECKKDSQSNGWVLLTLVALLPWGASLLLLLLLMMLRHMSTCPLPEQGGHGHHLLSSSIGPT